MAVKLIDLQLIYGVAGAQAKFDELASQLVERDQPDADKVRIEQGDGGLDVFVGNLTDPRGIEVYQCKFFPQGLGDSQKDQIRKSYRTCRDSKRFKVKKWTLCLPVDLSIEERTWFEQWRQKQAADGIEIENPWGATKLEGLLYQEKNRGLKESLFKEEYLTQIREMHGMMKSLVERVDEWFRDAEAEQKQLKQANALARHGEYVKQFVDALREEYLAAALRAASQQGFPSKRPPHWEVLIRPSWIPDQPYIHTLKQCWSIVESMTVRSNGWMYPVMRDEFRHNGQDWVGATRIHDFEVESWRFSQLGVFAHMFPVWDDVEMQDKKPDYWPWDLPKGFVPQHFLDIDVVIRTLTHIFRFAAGLADKSFDPGDGTVEVLIRILGTRDRVLMTWDDPRRLRQCYRASAASLENIWRCPRDELRRAPDGFAIKAAVWLFERFNWLDVSAGGLRRIQEARFAPHSP
jgi:hypothetical protein